MYDPLNNTGNMIDYDRDIYPLNSVRGYKRCKNVR